MRVPYETMRGEFIRVLNKYGIVGRRAELSATLFADASRDGIYTHGLNRFPKFIKSIENGSVDVNAEAEQEASLGMLERWNGHRGCGNLNAYRCMERAIELAHQQTIGVVALNHTNHWMRPGNYGLMAVKENCIGILWTNTVPNMPPWGGREARLGNNPVVFAVPNGEEAPVLLDVAVSMFSYGKLESYARQNRELPVDGGFNADQQITRNAADILATHQVLPIGYWKGSGISLMLDLIASALSGGFTSQQVGELPTETELSQVFIAIDLNRLPDGAEFAQKVRDTLAYMQTSKPVDPARPVYYPGKNMMKTRAENMEKGIPVEESVWEAVLKL